MSFLDTRLKQAIALATAIGTGFAIYSQFNQPEPIVQRVDALNPVRQPPVQSQPPSTVDQSRVSRGAIPVSSGSSSSSVAASDADSPLLNANFLNARFINAQSAIPKFGTKIVIGDNKPGFMHKLFTPFNFVSLNQDECNRRIKIEEEPRTKAVGARWLGGKLVGGDVDIKDMHPTLKYDINNELMRKYNLDFNAYISEMMDISLDEELSRQLQIDVRAKKYAFVYPSKAMGSDEFQKRARGDAGFFDRLKRDLTSIVGADIASIMIIGGFVYFDQGGNLIQAKAIVAHSTDNTLPLANPLLATLIPTALREEFQISVETSERREAHLRARDGLSNPVTAPELQLLGARSFGYIGQGYIPESKRNNMSEQEIALYENFWKETAPNGMFIYKFEDARHDCFVPIKGAGVEELGIEGRKEVLITLKNGRGQKSVNAAFEESCVVCYDSPPTVVYEIQGNRANDYVVVCCSECDARLAAGAPQNNPNAGRSTIYRRPVVEFYNIGAQLQEAKKMLDYQALNMQKAQQYQELKISQMAQSLDYGITLQDKASANIPERATKFRYVYQAENFWEPKGNSELNMIYNSGGFAYYDDRDNLVGVNFIAPSPNNQTKPLKFAPAIEVQIGQKQQRYCQLANDRRLPNITLPDLKNQGLSYYMWIPPKHDAFPSDYGQFIYFSADGTKVYAKKVIP